VGMGVAEAVELGSSGETCRSDGRQGAGAFIGKGEVAEGEVGKDGALARHGQSILTVNSIDK
jgi:hypothetical protein